MSVKNKKEEFPMEFKLNRNPVTKLLAMLMALVMLCGGAQAETIDTWEPEPDIQEYETINTIALAIVFSNGKAQCEVNVALRGDKKGSATMTFYRQNGSNWERVSSWSATTKGGTIASSKSISAVKGNTYKLEVMVRTSKETESAQKVATY